MSVSPAHAAAFYREVADSGIVWGTKDAGGFPAPRVNDSRRAMPFWTSESRALSIIQNVAAYQGFVPVAIDWVTFCERWVPGLIRDGFLAGIDWSGKSAKGFDIDPAELERNVDVLRKRD